MNLPEDHKKADQVENRNRADFLRMKECVIWHLQEGVARIFKKFLSNINVEPEDYSKQQETIPTKGCLNNEYRLNTNALVKIINLLADPKNSIADIAFALNKYEEENNIKLKWKNNVFHALSTLYVLENAEDYGGFMRRLKFMYHYAMMEITSFQFW